MNIKFLFIIKFRLSAILVIGVAIVSPSLVNGGDLFVIGVSPYCTETRTIGATTENPSTGEDLVPVLLEEFDGNELNRDVWRVAVDSEGDLNNCLDANVDSADNIQVHDGKLRLILRKEYYIQKEGYKGGGASRAAGDWVNSPEDLTLRPYTGARIDTDTKFNIDFCQPGRIDIKSTAFNSPGLVEASWLFFTDRTFYGDWPAGGEIEISEQPMGPNYFWYESVATSNVIYGGQFPFFTANTLYPVATNWQPLNVDPGVTHVWSLVWDALGMSFQVDGVTTMILSADDIRKRENNDPSSEEMISYLPYNYIMYLAGLPYGILSPEEIEDEVALGQVPWAGTYTEDRIPILFGGSRDNITRIPHPAPFDHNGFYLILDSNCGCSIFPELGGGPYGGVGGVFVNFESLNEYINANYPASFSGVVTREDLENIIPTELHGNLDVPTASMPLPNEETPVAIEYDYVRYYIAPGPTFVCHKYDEENRGTIQVNAHAVQAHLAHGDYIGQCRDQYVIGEFEN